MSGLVLKLVDAPDFDIDLSAVLPEHAATQTIDALKRLRLLVGKRRVAAGDLFEFSGTPGDELTLDGVTSRLRRIGYGMTSGMLRVTGTAGDELGALMTGGSIAVKGHSADYTGAGMRGGSIHVSGCSGDFAGGALPDQALGMRGGTICIGKHAGARAGDRMRRGVIIVKGDAGGFCGSNMVAGTVIVSGQAAPGIGLGMRRGTIVLFQDPAAIPATFNACGTFALPILPLLANYVKTVDSRTHARLRAVRQVRRYAGDIGADGQGELLIASD